MKKEILTREKIVSTVIVDPHIEIFKQGEKLGVDIFVKDQLLYKMSQFIFEKSIPERYVIHWFERPTFWEWLTRKPRRVKIKVNAKDIVIDPPITQYDTLRIYDIDSETEK